MTRPKKRKDIQAGLLAVDELILSGKIRRALDLATSLIMKDTNRAESLEIQRMIVALQDMVARHNSQINVEDLPAEQAETEEASDD